MGKAERRPATTRPGDARAPEVNDGSDYNYRMSVDNRYKTAAQSRKLLTQIVNAQGSYAPCRPGPEMGFYALSSALMSGALLGRPSTKTVREEDLWWQVYATATTHIQQLSMGEALPLLAVLVAAFASLFGTFAAKGNKPRPLQLVALLSLAAACLSFWPIFSGLFVSNAMDEYGSAVASRDFTWFGVVTIQAIQEFIGFGCNVGVAITALRLASSLDTDKKKDK